MNDVLTGIAQAAPAIGMIAAFACLIGGLYLVRTGKDRRKGVLLLIMTAVLVGNVLIWTLPTGR
ncbi:MULTISPECIES: hypothetical protein [unclassified Sphingomonas]|uniref:hypothetical protein n=1 Tax=unclassified Sphingomonas TaxID=196159 RepID=UPI00092C6847|nr:MULTISPECIES: hypothetical protein [unclassified Sphingomonas]OJU17338.1 MAG: hypothetical protein BGN95_19085 [Sphingomonas sp. 66-10]